MSFSADDHRYMAQALRLAETGLYTTSPNPRVGCVIVKDGRIVGEGAHLQAGGPHAEVHALRAAGALARGAEAYVTLEPCSHFGRTPPCADALLAAGVSRVVAAMQDPNPQVAGQGLARLAAQGVAVASGLMQTQAEALNPGFISRMTRQRPLLRSKIAASLDGRTALANGTSKWITGPAARVDVQHWRARSCAMLTGIGTVLADDPQLNVRELPYLSTELARQPLRVVVDRNLSIPLNARILQDDSALVVYATDPYQRAVALEAAGAELLISNDGHGRVDLRALMTALAQRGINEVLVEAGQGLNGALLQQGLIDELLLYQAPLLLGSDGRGMFAIPALTEMQQRAQLEILETRQLGVDLRIHARIQARIQPAAAS